MKKTIVGIATLPDRVDGLLDTLNSISPQVDKIYVWLNGHTEIPKVPHKNVVFHRSDTNDGAIAKIRCLELFDDTDFYYFMVDDDIIYPHDYIKHNIDIFTQNSIQSSHAKIFKSFPIQDYAHSDISGYYFGGNIPKKDRVHLVGTGVCMMESTTARQIPYNTFLTNNMLDLWISSWAWTNDLPMYVVPHKNKWLNPNPIINQDNSIWQDTLKNSEYQTHIINNYYGSK